MAAITEEYVPIPSGTLWTARQESGSPVVLLHGGPGLWDYLAPVATMLDEVATVYRYDQRACGRSLADSDYDFATEIADLERLREHWGIERWVVLGHSWGATLGLAYALTHPQRTAGLIYMSGTGIDPAWHAAFHANAATLHSLEEQQELDQLKQQLNEAKEDEFNAIDRAYCELSWSADVYNRSRGRELARQLFVGDLHPNYELNRKLTRSGRDFIEADDIPARLAALNVPTLVMHGVADPRPAWAGQQVAELLPNADLALVDECGHLPWLEQPTLTRRLLRDFLQDRVK